VNPVEHPLVHESGCTLNFEFHFGVSLYRNGFGAGLSEAVAVRNPRQETPSKHAKSISGRDFSRGRWFLMVKADGQRLSTNPNISGESNLEDAHVAALLVRRCIAGDAAAWEEIVQQYNRRIYNICYRFTGSANDAEDLTQEVFIKIYRTLNTYDLNRGAFMTWVTTVTRNLLVDHFRKARQERMTDSLDTTQSEHEDAIPLGERIPDRAPAPDSKVQSRETREAVHAALQKLSPELREAVILRDLQDMDYRDIAETLKVPEGTVKSRINRGRGELARLLQRTYRQVM
jgi:RNA polymerase sigma-70 factor, ECF subfamily